MARVLAPFQAVRYRPGMPDLRPATPEEIAQALAFALRFEGRRRVRHADELVARIAADRLVQHLERSGFVVMKRPAAEAPTTSRMPAPSGG